MCRVACNCCFLNVVDIFKRYGGLDCSFESHPKDDTRDYDAYVQVRTVHAKVLACCALHCTLESVVFAFLFFVLVKPNTQGRVGGS